jgi:hypothetical protein
MKRIFDDVIKMNLLYTNISFFLSLWCRRAVSVWIKNMEKEIMKATGREEEKWAKASILSETTRWFVISDINIRMHAL